MQSNFFFLIDPKKDRLTQYANIIRFCTGYVFCHDRYKIIGLFSNKPNVLLLFLIETKQKNPTKYKGIEEKSRHWIYFFSRDQFRRVFCFDYNIDVSEMRQFIPSFLCAIEATHKIPISYLNWLKKLLELQS